MNKNKRIFLEREIEIERHAKNTAYYFILSRGYIDDFRQFYSQNQPSDPYEACLEVIAKLAK